jgi:hypothetical protein
MVRALVLREAATVGSTTWLVLTALRREETEERAIEDSTIGIVPLLLLG